MRRPGKRKEPVGRLEFSRAARRRASPRRAAPRRRGALQKPCGGASRPRARGGIGGKRAAAERAGALTQLYTLPRPITALLPPLRDVDRGLGRHRPPPLGVSIFSRAQKPDR